MRKMRQKLVTLSLVVCIFLFCSVTASAQELEFERKGSISITLAEQEGSRLSVYRVAEIERDDNGKWRYVHDGEWSMEDPDLAVKIESYVEEYNVASVEIITDSQGKAMLADLPLGVYFVKQTGNVEGFTSCKPFVVTIPIKGKQGYVYDVDATPKTEFTKLTSITINKVWNIGKTAEMEESVVVQLLCDGAVVETVTLNKENDWRIILSDMPVNDSYSIREVNIPSGFTATYTKDGYEFTVTNTASLPQTGQLVWPIPILAIAGLLFLSVGAMILYRTRVRDA